MAADERDAAVDHDELAMVALVHDADVADVPVVELDDLAAGVLQLPLGRLAHFLVPVASSSTRTCTPARARSESASATRCPSAPSFHRNVSK